MTTKKSMVQDVDIAQVTSNVTTRRIYVQLHFVTAEFDYNTGRVFIEQMLKHLERIAPDAPQKTK